MTDTIIKIRVGNTTYPISMHINDDGSYSPILYVISQSAVPSPSPSASPS